jgi:hypothetical protein
LKEKFKIKSLVELYDFLPQEEMILTDVLRQIVLNVLAENAKEKFSYNVPFFYGNKSICLIWPASVPRGGFKSGVMIAFWYGKLLKDKNQYLTHGTNKQIFYKIFHSVDEINEFELTQILLEAKALDESFKKHPPSHS